MNFILPMMYASIFIKWETACDANIKKSAKLKRKQEHADILSKVHLTISCCTSVYFYICKFIFTFKAHVTKNVSVLQRWAPQLPPNIHFFISFSFSFYSLTS